jgi:hypothetical protein
MCMAVGWGRSRLIIIEFGPKKLLYCRAYLEIKIILAERCTLDFVFHSFHFIYIYIYFFFLLKVIYGLQNTLRTGLD